MSLRRAVLVALPLLCACKDNGRGPSRQASASRTAPTPARATVTRSLLDEAGRAELDSDGLLIDLGAPDQHKYVRRSWERTWGAVGNDGPVTFTRAESGARLHFQGRLPFHRLVLRARSAAAGQRCTVVVNGRRLRPVAVPGRWGEVEAAVAPSPGPGPLAIELRFARPGGAELDWLWLARRKGAAPSLERVRVVGLDEPRRALAAAPPRTYSFGLVVPRAARLQLAYGSRGQARFKVVAAVDGAPPRTLLERPASDGRWHVARLDLSRLAGKAVRLELSTAGAAGEGGWGEPELVSPERGRPPRAAGGPPARNLVHILVDAARREAYPVFNKKSPIPSPALDRLAREGTTFTGAVTPANWTYPSVATLFSGRYHFSFLRDTFPETVPVSEQVPLLQGELLSRGFATAAFVANPWINAQFGTSRGWGTLRSFSGEVRGETDAPRLFEAALAWLDELRRTAPRRRFYIYLHTMEPHAPYHYRKGFTERFLPEGTRPGTKALDKALHMIESRAEMLESPTAAQGRLLQALYRGAVAYHEHHLARFLSELDRRTLLGETLVVHTNDHGEELLDHGGMFHGHTLYEELTRCPMVLRYPPRFPAGARFSGYAELVDLVPTILETLGLPPIPGTDGRSLVPDPERSENGAMSHAISVGRNDRPRVPSPDGPLPLPQARAVWFGPYKLIVNHRQQVELYDLSRDPGERQNLAPTHPVAVRTGEILLLEAIAVPAKDRRLSSMETGRLGETPAPAPLSPALRRRLRALGYIND